MKIQEMREKTIDELSKVIIDCKKELFDLRLQKTLNKLEDTSKIEKARKTVAKAKTVIAEKMAGKVVVSKQVSANTDVVVEEAKPVKKTRKTTKKEENDEVAENA